MPIREDRRYDFNLLEKAAQDLCYDAIADSHAAKFRYGRAMEEGAGAWPDRIKARKRLDAVTIDNLVAPESHIAERGT
jgi:hypothetical protein